MKGRSATGLGRRVAQQRAEGCRVVGLGCGGHLVGVGVPGTELLLQRTEHLGLQLGGVSRRRGECPQLAGGPVRDGDHPADVRREAGHGRRGLQLLALGVAALGRSPPPRRGSRPSTPRPPFHRHRHRHRHRSRRPARAGQRWRTRAAVGSWVLPTPEQGAGRPPSTRPRPRRRCSASRRPQPCDADPQVARGHRPLGQPGALRAEQQGQAVVGGRSAPSDRSTSADGVIASTGTRAAAGPRAPRAARRYAYGRANTSPMLTRTARR